MKLHHTLLASALFVAVPQASAGDWQVSVGGFYSTSNTTMDVTSPLTDKSIELDFERDLELSERELLPYLNLSYAFNDKHTVYFDWKSLRRNATKEKVTKPFETDLGGDQKYQVQAGAKINSTLNIDIARIGYGYTFYEDNNWDLTATLGAHVMWLEIGFSGEIGACVDNNCSGPVTVAPNTSIYKDATAPLPDIGLVAEYKINEQWSLIGHGQYFYLKVDEISGSLIDFNGGAKYQFNDNFTASLSYSYYEVDVDVDGKLSDLNVNFNFHGPMFTLQYEF
ncbi:DUF2490 domain-containing protein [Motilimonas cestriensis]|uniref:DUF2490 domain-containing protein n=1 Tax=Motilimonas cestriensis TaxID=2742685 RepID=A0ABS8W7V0_9GAMM|nr:DUF2490 domain-containing protein [Motilimonas cestriensis]MCE2593884.1 DUF2490 domain-containing protein [Motilimonas cestriensis]